MPGIAARREDFRQRLGGAILWALGGLQAASSLPWAPYSPSCWMPVRTCRQRRVIQLILAALIAALTSMGSWHSHAAVMRVRGGVLARARVAVVDRLDHDQGGWDGLEYHVA
jgi:hypothetical protein